MAITPLGIIGSTTSYSGGDIIIPVDIDVPRSDPITGGTIVYIVYAADNDSGSITVVDTAEDSAPFDSFYGYRIFVSGTNKYISTGAGVGNVRILMGIIMNPLRGGVDTITVHALSGSPPDGVEAVVFGYTGVKTDVVGHQSDASFLLSSTTLAEATDSGNTSTIPANFFYSVGIDINTGDSFGGSQPWFSPYDTPTATYSPSTAYGVTAWLASGQDGPIDDTFYNAPIVWTDTGWSDIYSAFNILNNDSSFWIADQPLSSGNLPDVSVHITASFTGAGISAPEPGNPFLHILIPGAGPSYLVDHRIATMTPGTISYGPINLSGISFRSFE